MLQFGVDLLALIHGELAFGDELINQILGFFAGYGHRADAGQEDVFESVAEGSHTSLLCLRFTVRDADGLCIHDAPNRRKGQCSQREHERSRQRKVAACSPCDRPAEVDGAAGFDRSRPIVSRASCAAACVRCRNDTARSAAAQRSPRSSSSRLSRRDLRRERTPRPCRAASSDSSLRHWTRVSMPSDMHAPPVWRQAVKAVVTTLVL